MNEQVHLSQRYKERIEKRKLKYDLKSMRNGRKKVQKNVNTD